MTGFEEVAGNKFQEVCFEIVILNLVQDLM
jgi:hypothetical protein